MNITLNGTTFHPKNSGATLTYDVTRGGNIRLFDSGAWVGGINRHGVLHSTTRIDGKHWHGYGQPKAIPPYSSYMQEKKECHAALDSIRER